MPVIPNFPSKFSNGNALFATLDEDGLLSKEQRPSPEQLGAVSVQRMINGNSLSTDVILTPPDIGAASNPNLLDNWYFADPVNQKKATEYTAAGYTIDRWLVDGKCTVSVVEGSGLRLTWSGVGIFRQIFENPSLLNDKIVTLTGVFDDVDIITGKSIKLRLRINGDWALYSVSVDNNGVFSRALACPSNTTSFYIEIGSDAGSCLVSALKLELGPVQTLAHQDASGTWVLNDPAPDKALELLKCQLYQFNLFDHKSSGQAYIIKAKAINETTMFGSLNIPTTMRGEGLPLLITDCSTTNPYFAFGIFTNGYVKDNPVTSMSVYSREENGFIIKANSSNLIAGNDYQIYVTNQYQHKFILDSNL